MGTRLAWALGLSAALATSMAGADEQRDRARQHFDRAVSLLEQKKYAEALNELEEAYTLHPHASVLYNIGMTHLAMGNSVAAAKNLERYLEEAGSAAPSDRRLETQRVLDELASRLATLVLDVRPLGARVTLNGADLGAAPLSGPITLVAGHQELVLTHAGYRSERRSLDLRSRTTTSLEIRLSVDAAATIERALLEIDCPVPDATIYVDDAAIARTPVTSVLIPPGPHRVEFRRAGYETSRHSVLTAKGVSSSALCQLVPSGSGATGRIKLEGPAASGTAWVDGKELAADGRIPAGKHRVKLVAVGHRPWEGDVVVAAGKTSVLGASLTPTDETLRDRASQRTWAYALGAHGLGFMLIAGGIYVWNDDRYQTWQARQDGFDKRWRDADANTSFFYKEQTQNDDLRESIKQFDLVSVGFGLTGAVLFASGAVLYFTGESPTAATGPVITATPTGVRGQWSVRW